MTACKVAALVVGCFVCLSPALAQTDPAGFTDRVFKDADSKEHKYVLFMPTYDAKKTYPLILFLHGAGEREGGTKAPVEVGIGPAIKKLGQDKFPFFVLIPRCGAAPNNWQADGPDAQRALAMLEQVQKDYNIDKKRVYLTGLSMGGYGTWSLAAKYPDKWAAIVPICGGAVRPKEENAAEKTKMVAEKIKHIPCWCFHGDADKSVPVQLSRDIIKALKDVGGKPKYDEYEGVGHNSWDKAYATKELYDWLLMQKLK